MNKIKDNIKAKINMGDLLEKIESYFIDELEACADEEESPSVNGIKSSAIEFVLENLISEDTITEDDYPVLEEMLDKEFDAEETMEIHGEAMLYRRSPSAYFGVSNKDFL